MRQQFDMDDLVRPNIRKLKPYHSAREDFSKGILLDANENSQGAPDRSLEGLHRYPSPKQQKLRREIADFRDVKPQNVFVGSGSDEAIDLLFRIFCRPGKDRVITTPPTYGMYRVSARIHDIPVDEVQLDAAFQPKVEAILEQVTDQTKLLFLCSPNNPTGNLMDRDKVDQLVENFPGIVIIDEAYIDFSEQQSYAAQVANHPNLVVLQTMSKSFGLAGIRLGMAFASEAIIELMMKVKAPYNISRLTSKAANEAFENIALITQHIEIIKKERKRLREELSSLSLVDNIFPSDANFLLVKFQRAKQIYDKLIEQNIILRYRGDQPGCDDCLRITIGTREENNELLEALETIS